MKSVAVWAVWVGMCLAFLQFAHAETVSVAVTPAAFELKIPPGQSGSHTVRFLNRGPRALNVRPEVLDWAPNVDGVYVPVASGVLGNSVVPWITVYPAAVLIPVGQTGTFNVTVSVPRGVHGGQYAAVFLRARENLDDGSTGMGVGTDIGVKVLIDTGTTTPQLEARLAYVSPPTPSEKLKLTMEIKNTGSVHVIAEPTIDLIGPMQDFVGTILPDLRGILLMPGQTQSVDFEWGGSLAPAQYDALGTVFFGDQRAAVDELKFTVPDKPAFADVGGRSERNPPGRLPVGVPGASGGAVTSTRGGGPGATVESSRASGPGHVKMPANRRTSEMKAKGKRHKSARNKRPK